MVFSRPQTRWLGCSVLVTWLYAIVPLIQAFRDDFVVDSDARQHVFWMARFLDPGLFPNDWIADYHQSVAPVGYALLYRLAAAVGIEPFAFNKLLPPVLATIAIGFVFRFCREIGLSLARAFLATVLLNQALWIRYDIVTGTARSFIYPLLALFLFHLARKEAIGIAGAIVLQGLFYPQCVLVACGTLVLRIFRSWRKGRSEAIASYLLGMVAGVLVLLPYVLQGTPFDPAIDAATARQMPEFLPGGRVEFFHANAIEFLLWGKRSGLLPRIDRVSVWLWLGVLLPVSLWRARWQGQTAAPAARRERLGILSDVAIASVGVFGLAHLVLFRIHHPSRYTMHSLLMVLAIAAAIWLAPKLGRARSWLQRRIGAYGAIAIFTALLAIVPPLAYGYRFKYKQGPAPELYTFLQAQPPATMTASLSRLGNDLPSHARRGILASPMYAIPYHVGYYREIQNRVAATLAAQYTTDPAVLARVVRQYGIDFFLLDRDAFAPNYLTGGDRRWLRPFAGWQQAADSRQAGSSPSALERQRNHCVAIAGETWELLDAACATGEPRRR